MTARLNHCIDHCQRGSCSIASGSIFFGCTRRQICFLRDLRMKEILAHSQYLGACHTSGPTPNSTSAEARHYSADDVFPCFRFGMTSRNTLAASQACRTSDSTASSTSAEDSQPRCVQFSGGVVHISVFLVLLCTSLSFL